MSKRDFDLEFKQIEQQYTEMVNNLREMEKEMNEGLVEPEFVERLRSIVDPIIVNYKVWDYIRFLFFVWLANQIISLPLLDKIASMFIAIGKFTSFST